MANQLGSEVALTERLDSELIRSLSQRPDGQDTASVSDLADSEVSMDGNVPSRLQVKTKCPENSGFPSPNQYPTLPESSLLLELFARTY